MDFGQHTQKPKKAAKEKSKPTKIDFSEMGASDLCVVNVDKSDPESIFITIDSFQHKNHTLIQSRCHELFHAMERVYWSQKAKRENIIFEVYLKYRKLIDFIEITFK